MQPGVKRHDTKAVAKCNRIGYAGGVPYRPFADQNCSIARALEVIGERWTLLVMREILLGRRRFADLQRNTGIAKNILSDRLQTLVDQGLLERRLYSQRPESFEYRPTQKGLDVAPVLVALLRWGDQYAAPGRAAAGLRAHRMWLRRRSAAALHALRRVDRAAGAQGPAWTGGQRTPARRTAASVVRG